MQQKQLENSINDVQILTTKILKYIILVWFSVLALSKLKPAFLFLSSPSSAHTQPPPPHTLTHSTHTSQPAVCLGTPTCLWRVNGHFIGVRPNSIFALGSQLESVGGEGLQGLHQVGGGRLKAHFSLKRGKNRKEIQMILSSVCTPLVPLTHPGSHTLPTVQPLMCCENSSLLITSIILTSSVSSTLR